MAVTTRMKSHQSAVDLAGTWKLAGGVAITLRPREAGVLRIAQGSVWATSDAPRCGFPNAQGDHVLGAGDQLAVRRGERVVIEAWDRSLPAYFLWGPLQQPASQRAGIAELAQPVDDLRRAVELGAGAAGRLLAALARLGWAWLGRERTARAEWALKAHSSA
ncbi:MAG: hypothetical protein NVS3B2_05510 [Ramlibacter sp.]